MQKTKDIWILKNFVIHHPEVLRVANHVRPKSVIVVELREAVKIPTLMPLKNIMVLLPRKDMIAVCLALITQI